MIRFCSYCCGNQNAEFRGSKEGGEDPIWMKTKNQQMSIPHWKFGYDVDEVRKNKYHLFPTDDFMPRLREFYRFARENKLARKKSQIIIDHDPRYPIAMVQVVTDKMIFLSHEQGLRIHEAEANRKSDQCHEELFGHTGIDQSIRETLGYPE